MGKGLLTIILLIVSNSFMTLAWYGQIAFKSKFEKLGLVARFFRTKEELEKISTELSLICDSEESLSVKDELEKVNEKVKSIVGGL